MRGPCFQAFHAGSLIRANWDRHPHGSQTVSSRWVRAAAAHQLTRIVLPAWECTSGKITALTLVYAMVCLCEQGLISCPTGPVCLASLEFIDIDGDRIILTQSQPPISEKAPLLAGGTQSDADETANCFNLSTLRHLLANYRYYSLGISC